MKHIPYAITLPSGVQLLIVDTPGATHAEIAISLNAGYRIANVDPDINCLETPHLLEHCVFDGSQNHPSTDELQNIYTKGNGSWNGITTAYHVHYTFRSKTNYALEVLSTALDMVYNPLLSERSFQEELAVIINEAEDSMSDFSGNAGLTMIQQALPDFTMRSLELRDSASLASLEEVRRYHKKYYTRKNTTITIVCDLEKLTRESLVGTIEAGVKHAPVGRRYKLPVLALNTPATATYPEKLGRSIPTVFTSIGYIAAEQISVSNTIKSVLFVNMVTNMKSYSVQHQLRKLGLAYSMTFVGSGSLETGGFELLIETSRPKLAELLTATLTMIHTLAYKGISETAFENLKQELGESYEEDMDSDEVFSAYFYNYLMAGELFSQKAYQNTLKSITQESVLAYAQSFISKNHQYAAVFSSKATVDAIKVDSISSAVFSGKPIETAGSVFAKEMEKYYTATPESTRRQKMFIFINQRPWLAGLLVSATLLIGLTCAIRGLTLLGESVVYGVILMIIGLYLITESIANAYIQIKRSKR